MWKLYNKQGVNYLGYPQKFILPVLKHSTAVGCYGVSFLAKY